MQLVPRAYSTAEVAAEAACPEERVRWMTRIGLITPDEHGRLTFGAVLAVRMASALLETGVPAESIERAATEGLLSFQRTDEYLPYEPGPRSERTFAEFQASAGPRAELLPAVYEVLGLPKPDPAAPIHSDEEAMFERFLDAWAMTPDEDSLIRAARLMAQGTRAAMLGWMDLQDEQLAEPARERLLRGELKEFPDDVRVAFMKVTHLAAEMFTWLSARYLENRSVSGIVDGFERFLASRGLAPIPELPSPPSIVFVDLSGFTRLTRERGDESAVAAATSLQRHADATATRHGGRLVKLLGDGAMLRLTDATVGVDAALDLVETMSGEGALAARGRPHRPRDRARPRRLRADRQPGVAYRGRGGAWRRPCERGGRRGVPGWQVRVRTDAGYGAQGAAWAGCPVPGDTDRALKERKTLRDDEMRRDANHQFTRCTAL
jgi:adenylate cyclase